jgi:ketosteroid isomerase-like protein
MFYRGIKCCAWILMLCAILCAAPAMAKDESDLAGRAATWEKEYNAGNLKAVAALYAADGCRMPPNAPISQGSDAILGQLQTGKDNGIAKVTIAVTMAETSGDWGSGTGTYEITGADGSHMDHGKWMNVSKKVKGKWMIQCDIFNSDMPIPTAK